LSREKTSFKFLRKYSTKDQFLKAFHGAVFCASSAGFETYKSRFKTKFKSLYFRLQRMACKDCGFTKFKEELTAKETHQMRVFSL